MKVGNDCAFPSYMHEEMGVREGYFDAGMSKREYFAGQAIPSLISWYATNQYAKPDVLTAVVKDSVAFADALIAELERTK